MGADREYFRSCGCGSPVSNVVRSAFLKIEGNSFKSAPGVKMKLIFKCGIAPFCLSALNFGNVTLQNTQLFQMDNSDAFQ